MVFQSNSNTVGMGWVGGKFEQLFQSWQKGKSDLLYYFSGGYRQLFFLKRLWIVTGLRAWGREVGKQVSVRSMNRGLNGGFS